MTSSLTTFLLMIFGQIFGQMIGHIITVPLISLMTLPMVGASHQLQCMAPGHVGRYFYDVCELRCECTQPSTGLFNVKCFREREDFTCMDDGRRQRFIQTYLAVSTPTHPLYGQLQYLIAKHEIGFSTIHTSRWFLPWHRAYLQELENLLRLVDCRVTVPYWPYSDRPTDPFPYLPFGQNYGLGDNGDVNNGNCVTNGPFASPWIPPSRSSCLTRSFQQTSVLPTLTQLNSILATAASAYGSFSDQIQYSYHNGVHVTVGGDLATSHSTVDLLFFLLHGNVDRAWDTWQKQSSSKLNAYGGNSATTAMPFMFGKITFSDVKSLEVSGIRYVKMQSDPQGLNHPSTLVCSSILLASGWFSASVIESQILAAPLSMLVAVPQTAPMTLSPAQQETWLQSMPSDMRSSMRVLLKQSEDQTKALARRLTNIIDPNNSSDSTESVDFLSRSLPRSSLSGDKKSKHPRTGMNLNDLVNRLGLAPECPPTADSCDIDPQAKPRFLPPSARPLTQRPTTRQPTLKPTRQPTLKPTTRQPTLKPTTR